MAAIQPNPSVPVVYDPANGYVRVVIDQYLSAFSAQGLAVLAETNASGNLYLVPAGKTFVGIALLIVGAGTGASGSVKIQDASATVIHSAASAGVGNPASVAGVSVSGEAGGGGGNQLSVVLVGGGQVISAVVAGYLH